MDEYSTPAIEGVMREAIQDDTSVAVDSVLLDANRGDRCATRWPAEWCGCAHSYGGRRHRRDRGRHQAARRRNYGRHVRQHPQPGLVDESERRAFRLARQRGQHWRLPVQGGDQGGTLATIPIIDSSTVPAKTLILVDAADFVSVGGGAPRFEMSDSALRCILKTPTPAELVAAGSPGVVAAPQRSLFQTD